MPIRRSSSASNSAVLRQSPACSGRVETEGMRKSAFNSSRNRGWLARAKDNAEEGVNGSTVLLEAVSDANEFTIWGSPFKQKTCLTAKVELGERKTESR